jgi:hypothetical protein
MKNMVRFLLLFCFSELRGQEPPRPPIDMENFLERLFPIQEEDIDYESIYEVLFQLYLNPIDINKADAEVLQSTYILNPEQISQLIAYRNKNGDLLSLYELQAVPGFDLQTVESILPFIVLGNTTGRTQSFWQRVKNEENAYLIFRHRRTWETRRGFTPPDTARNGTLSTRYLGDPNEYYLRFRIQHSRDFSFGITLDKDPGEQFTWDSKTARYGFNFFSFHFTRYFVGKWRTISVGDFSASFGQGLVFGAGYTLGKGAETVPTVRKSGIGILPYTAALEFGFFRGLGATYQLKNIRATVIASHAPRDGRASVIDSLENSSQIISSLSQSGLHRTPSELSTKNQFRETNLGGNLQYIHPSGKFQVGGNGLYTQFDFPWIRDPRTYNQFEFAGKTNFVSSMYFNYNWKNFFLFGESAASKSGGNGTVLGLVSSLSKQVDFSFLWRKYDRDFHSFYANGFSEGTRPINEQGVYLGLQIRPEKRWRFNAYYDFFQFPWLRYRVYSPSKGYEWLTRISYQPKRSLIAFFQIREERKDRNLPDSGEPSLPYLVLPMNKINGMLSLENQATKSLFLRSRILFSEVRIENKKSSGFMVLQDVQFGREKWRLTGRVALFDTDNYDNRLYAFENHVLWTFSVPAFSGQGMRYYLLGQYRILPNLTTYLRFSRTTYTDREVISSGLQTIAAPHQTETSLLIRYNLN